MGRARRDVKPALRLAAMRRMAESPKQSRRRKPAGQTSRLLEDGGDLAKMPLPDALRSSNQIPPPPRSESPTGAERRRIIARVEPEAKLWVSRQDSMN
jgi:hypothetical protein